MAMIEIKVDSDQGFLLFRRWIDSSFPRALAPGGLLPHDIRREFGQIAVMKQGHWSVVEEGVVHSLLECVGLIGEHSQLLLHVVDDVEGLLDGRLDVGVQEGRGVVAVRRGVLLVDEFGVGVVLAELEVVVVVTTSVSSVALALVGCENKVFGTHFVEVVV